MLLSATDFYLLKEIPGELHNMAILNFFSEIGHSWIRDDETAWCSAFINYLAKINGVEYSNKLDARSWLNVGANVTEPSVGDIVVYWRESLASWKGHVGLYMGHIDDQVFCLGGNQDNMVCIKPYPLNRLLGFRRLTFTNP